MLISSAIKRLRRDERGFTLVEVLVASVTGLIVAAALFSILEFSTKQSTREADYVQATQLGRQAMTHLVDELHSACLASGTNFRPVRESTKPGTVLVFVDAITNEAEITKAVKHEIIFENGNLTDKSYASASGTTWPTFTSFNSTPEKSVRFAEHVEETPELKGRGLFGYRRYVASSAERKLESIFTEAEEKEKKPLTAAAAKEAAAVTVSFRALPSDASTLHPVDMSSQVTLALGTPSESTTANTPCE